MAAGKDHFKCDMIINFVSIPIAISYPHLINELIIGNILGTLFTCDVDDSNGTYSEVLLANITRRILVYLGVRKKTADNSVKFIYRFQTALTAPYGIFVSHRSWLSHAPIVSTITITGYLWLLYYLYCQIRNVEAIPFLTLYQMYEVAFYVIAVHHFGHYLMDGGLILFMGKQVYTLTYPFYFLTTKLFPQGKND